MDHNNQSNHPLLEVSNLIREFPAGESTIQILKSINLKIYAGELVAIVGQSGSGKSTLMNILGCLDQPTSGSYQVNGRETRELEADELAQLAFQVQTVALGRHHKHVSFAAGQNLVEFLQVDIMHINRCHDRISPLTILFSTTSV